ncbi:MAG: hypothetical protein AAF531_04865 [Actinomycetota bacterium]
MVLELGPLPAADVLDWTKFVRRLSIELRSVPAADAVVSTDVIELWSKTLTVWATAAQQAGSDDLPFRWSSDMEPEMAEYLLHGMDKCLHSPLVMSWVTPEEATRHRPVTMSIVRAFVDGLAVESKGCRHYADQILSSLRVLLAES